MIATLDLARFPLGIAEREALVARRAGRRSDARFARLLLPILLRSVPLPLPQLTSAYYLALWDGAEAAARFRAGPLRRWGEAGEHLSLTLRPVQSFGTWLGADPLAGAVSEPEPGPVLLVTHSRTRPRHLARFLIADRPVVRALEAAPGRLWSGGFVDGPARLDTGTISLWRDTAAATGFAYAPGAHQTAVRAQRADGWFSESWFARFGVEAASGRWGDLDPAGLTVPPSPVAVARD